MYKKGDELELRIADMAFGGKGIARMETDLGKYVVFVPNTITGQLVRCRMERIKKKYAEARLLEVVERSSLEVAVPYQPIAGAPYITLPLAQQEQHKKEATLDLFRKIGGFAQPESHFDTYISSPLQFHYRNKMEYSFAAIRYDLETSRELDEFALGFKHRGTWWMVENLDADSGLFDAQVENNLKVIREFCEKSGLPPWHAPKREGFFRFLTVRKSFSEDQLLFNLVTTSRELEKFDLKGFVELMKSLFAERLSGILHTLNDDIGDRVQPLEGESKLIFGEDKIEEDMLGLKFDISMQSFFQTNPKSAALLYQKALEYVAEGRSGSGYLLDMFCGTGTIAQLLAKQLTTAQVIGVDIVPEAIADAKNSAAKNQLENVAFHAADVGKFLSQNPHYENKIDVVVLDPPRGGIAPKSLKKVLELNAGAITYISCNPATLARDMEIMRGAGYHLKKFSLVDQFPHTSHVEAVALFLKH